MRAILLASLALAASLHTASDACGYIPRIRAFVVSNHWARGGQREFVRMGGPVPDWVAWFRLAPHSYDATMIADAPALDAPIEMTLVGAAGTRVVSTTHEVYLSQDWQARGETSAVEVDTRGASFEVAIAGSHPEATWAPIGGASSTTEAASWLRAQGIDASTASVARLPGDRYEIVSGYARGAATPTYVLRYQTQMIAQLGGDGVGVITIGGMGYLVVAEGGGLTTEIL